MAHSKGLPCHLSATEIHRPKGQMTVVQRDYNRSTQHDIQTIRVSNAQGRPVCVMTLIGTQTMTPGSKLHIQWDFPNKKRRQQQPYNHQMNMIHGYHVIKLVHVYRVRNVQYMKTVRPNVRNHLYSIRVMSGSIRVLQIVFVKRWY